MNNQPSIGPEFNTNDDESEGVPIASITAHPHTVAPNLEGLESIHPYAILQFEGDEEVEPTSVDMLDENQVILGAVVSEHPVIITKKEMASTSNHDCPVIKLPWPRDLTLPQLRLMNGDSISLFKPDPNNPSRLIIHEDGPEGKLTVEINELLDALGDQLNFVISRDQHNPNADPITIVTLPITVTDDSGKQVQTLLCFGDTFDNDERGLDLSLSYFMQFAKEVTWQIGELYDYKNARDRSAELELALMDPSLIDIKKRGIELILRATRLYERFLRSRHLPGTRPVFSSRAVGASQAINDQDWDKILVLGRDTYRQWFRHLASVVAPSPRAKVSTITSVPVETVEIGNCSFFVESTFPGVITGVSGNKLVVSEAGRSAVYEIHPDGSKIELFSMPASEEVREIVNSGTRTVVRSKGNFIKIYDSQDGSIKVIDLKQIATDASLLLKHNVKVFDLDGEPWVIINTERYKKGSRYEPELTHIIKLSEVLVKGRLNNIHEETLESGGRSRLEVGSVWPISDNIVLVIEERYLGVRTYEISAGGNLMLPLALNLPLSSGYLSEIISDEVGLSAVCVERTGSSPNTAQLRVDCAFAGADYVSRKVVFIEDQDMQALAKRLNVIGQNTDNIIVVASPERKAQLSELDLVIMDRDLLLRHKGESSVSIGDMVKLGIAEIIDMSQIDDSKFRKISTGTDNHVFVESVKDDEGRHTGDFRIFTGSGIIRISPKK